MSSVYMIRAGVIGPVKIGYTADVAKRLKAITPPKPSWTWIMRTFIGARAEEKFLHQKFASLSLGGEWFNYHSDMLGDLGLMETPPPRVKRNGMRYERPDTAHRTEAFFHQDVLGLIGGPDGLSRALGNIPAGQVMSVREIREEYWPAAVVLVRQAGRGDLTLDIFRALRAATKAAYAEEERLAAAKKKPLPGALEETKALEDWTVHNGVHPFTAMTLSVIAEAA